MLSRRTLLVKNRAIPSRLQVRRANNQHRLIAIRRDHTHATITIRWPNPVTLQHLVADMRRVNARRRLTVREVPVYVEIQPEDEEDQHRAN